MVKWFHQPKEEDKDPCYYDESYPGYVKYLPCGKHNSEGKPWYKVYKQEILWAKFLSELKNIEEYENWREKMQYIVFDLEATCWEGKRDKISEIIEIGAVKLNDKLEITDEFSEFVRPVLNPELSSFCKDLTKIKQEYLDSAESFEEVIKKFEKWIETDENFYVLSWGYYDKKQILSESKNKGYNGRIIKILVNHVSLKHRFAEIKSCRPCGMAKALNLLNLKLDGTHHRGIDDARNITRIFKVIYLKLGLSS